MSTNPLTGARYPANSDSPAGPQQIQNAVDDLSPLTTPVYTSTTTRDTAYSTWTTGGHSRKHGSFVYTQADKQMWMDDGTAWVWPRWSQGTLAYVEYASPGGSAITLNTADTVLTIYSLPTFTVPANRRLRLVHHVTLQSTTSTCAFAFHYKLAGTSFRTSVQGIPFVSVAHSQSHVFDFAPSAGSIALTISGFRLAGTGTPQLLCDDGTSNTFGPTQFWVEDIGAAS